MMNREYLDKVTIVLIILAVMFIGLNIGLRVTLANIAEQAKQKESIDTITENVQLPVPSTKRFINQQEQETYQQNFNLIKERNRKISDHQVYLILDAVKVASNKYNIAEEVILGLIDIESSFRHMALSHCQAFGLMQINYSVWATTLRAEGIANHRIELAVPSINIMAGTYVLAHYVKEAKRRGYKTNNDILKYAVTRYNGGYTNKHFDRLYTTMLLHNKIKKRKVL